MPWRSLVVWLLVVAAATAVLRGLAPRVDKAHMALAFLLVVLAGSARAGRVVGLVVAVASFLTFNFFLIPPFHTFRVAEPLDWGVLGAFLITGGVAAELLHRQQRATAVAERRAQEMDRLAGLGAESLSVGRAEEAIAAIVRVIQSELPVGDARIRLRRDLEWREVVDGGLLTTPEDPRSELIGVALRERRIVAVRRDDTSQLMPVHSTLADVLPLSGDFVELIVPLRARDRTLGVLQLMDGEGLAFQETHVSFADALAYYAALAAERTRLAAEAAHVEALREADRLKDAVLASLSHDLRTPLTSIRATANELRVGGEERAAVIEEEADRLNRLVTDLLDLSRLRAGSVAMELEVNAAEDLVGAALQRVGSVPGSDAVRVQLPPGELPVGRFDFVHSLRALTNLLENALRHSPDVGSVEVEVEQDAAVLHIRVLDRGSGVSAPDRGRLFEPFFRSASAAGHQGTGLGLAIARSVAEAQGGSVRYEPRPGGGSVFELLLPGASVEGEL
ncbi:MAG: ATP-binding protein [Candidatus Longimicrobiales bacterium M2_2A_002]